MENVIVIVILLALVAGIILFLIRAKRTGKKCIGCPYANQCCKKCPGSKKGK